MDLELKGRTALVTGAAVMPGTLLAQSAGTAAGRRVDTHFHFYPPEISNDLGSGARNWSLQKAPTGRYSLR